MLVKKQIHLSMPSQKIRDSKHKKKLPQNLKQLFY
jgi:hypothetical protein